MPAWPMPGLFLGGSRNLEIQDQLDSRGLRKPGGRPAPPPAPSVLLPPSVWKTRAGGKRLEKSSAGDLQSRVAGLK